MALTIEVVEKGMSGHRHDDIVDITFDDSYPTGGEPFAAGDIGRNRILSVLIEPAGGVTFEYDYGNEKIVARTTDLSSSTDGPMVELPNTSAALDGITARARIKAA